MAIAITTSSPITIAASSDAKGYARKHGQMVQLASSGATGAVSWEVVVGRLPDGVTLIGDRISGIPQEIGSATVTIRATDSASPPTFARGRVHRHHDVT